MNAWGKAIDLAIWAAGPFEAMGSKFRAKRGGLDSGEVWAIVLTFAGVAVAGWLLSRWLARQEEGKRPFHSRGRLFRTLCAAHELPRQDRWLLRRLARAHRLRDPARVFLEPERYDAQALSPAWQARQSELERLRQQLFGDCGEPR